MMTPSERRKDHPNLVDAATVDESYREAEATRENSMLHRVLAMQMRALNLPDEVIKREFGYLPDEISDEPEPGPGLK